eukprot:PhM_4_TR169/c0_g1_i1/m.53445/K17525/CHID1; chitinase domain-containing protein 1
MSLLFFSFLLLLSTSFHPNIIGADAVVAKMRSLDSFEPLPSDQITVDTETFGVATEKDAAGADTHLQDITHDDYACLGYVTPWNPIGYELAVEFADRFTHISPVWFDIMAQRPQSVFLQGQQNLNKTWVERMKERNPLLKLVPRFKIELAAEPTGTGITLQELLSPASALHDGVLDAIARVVERESQHIDGVVLEWGFLALTDTHMRPHLVKFTRALSERINSNKKELILVVPSHVEKRKKNNNNQQQQQQQLVSHVALMDFKSNGGVSRFSVMTYDHNTNPRPPGGFNAPMEPFLRRVTAELKNKNKKKSNSINNNNNGDFGWLLMGLNFYGYDYSAEEGMRAVVAREYQTEILLSRKTKQPRKSLSWQWDEKAQEHVVRYTDKKKITTQGKQTSRSVEHVLYFPTPRSVRTRVDYFVARERMSLSIWEIGQGTRQLFEVLPKLELLNKGLTVNGETAEEEL